MALAYNMKEQLAKRLQADFPLRFIGASAALSYSASGYPVIDVTIGGSVAASVLIKPRSYSGFNVVAELSSSAAEGLPEHQMNALILTSLDDVQKMLVFATLSQMGIASIKVGLHATPAAQNKEDETLFSSEFVNSTRLGAVGQ